MRPSLALCMIVRDEVHNLPRLFESGHGCFDEVHITDTGSTDGTVEWLKTSGALAIGCPVFVHHFEWINDFAQARNYSFSHAKTDYVMWMDGDDELHNPAGFRQWRDFAMQFADGWYANYHYAVDDKKNPIISFVRERVVKNNGTFDWKYFVHEGLVPNGRPNMSIAHVWSVKHLRSQEDFNKDRSRNLKMLDEKKSELGSRLLFYYGKELFDNGKVEEALKVLLDATLKTDLENHDRILALQYACYALIQLAEMMKPEFQGEKLLAAEKLAKQGLELAPTRAEFHCIIGDSFLKRNNLLSALPHFYAAEGCLRADMVNQSAMDPIFHFKDCYDVYPKTQRMKIYYHLGLLDKAQVIAQELVQKNVPQAVEMLNEIQQNQKFALITDEGREKSDAIVFTCPPGGAYPFDEVLYKQKGQGGSETALIEMAMHLKATTGRQVIVFNEREHNFTGESGVEWRSVKEVPVYFAKYTPKVHIAWRHNVRVTSAPTYLWCHDLNTAGVEHQRNFDKILCLSDFHKNFVMAMQGVPENQIVQTRNGISPSKFDFIRPPKDSNKIVWLSSPDRGLDRAMRVCDIVRKTSPEIKLHVYYGLDNLYKYGQKDRADHLKKMMDERSDYVVYHGFTEQNKMAKDIADAVCWIHPCDFIETFGITALESLALGIYPVTRKLGALANTLAEAVANSQATLLDHDCITPEEHEAYAREVTRVLVDRMWEKVNLTVEKHSWKSVAQDWVKFMELCG